MSRLIDPVPRGGELFAGNTKSAKAQTYLERVAKYVPAEIIAAYLTLLTNWTRTSNGSVPFDQPPQWIRRV